MDHGKTLYEHEHDYLERLRSLKYSPRTVKKRRQVLDLFVPWLKRTFGVLEAERLQGHHLDAWQQHLFAHRTVKGYPLKPSSINSQVSCVQGFLRYLVDRGHVLKALLPVLDRVKEPSVLPTSVLTHAQVRKLLGRVDMSSPAGYRNRALLEMLYSTGVRAEELLTLDVAHIDFAQGTAFVHGKGEKDRVVPIGKTALRYLTGYVTAVRPFLAWHASEPALFINAKGKRLAYHNLRYMLRCSVRAAGIESHVSPHTFRRSCTTEMVRQGANIYHVKELLGHETLKTMSRYVKLTIVDLKRTHAKCHPREKDNR